jgi:hypothetical protein
MKQHCRGNLKEKSSLRRGNSCQEFHIGRMLRTGEEARVADDLAFDGGREIEFWVKDAC